ncbi:hypothetical protein [Streptomyces sp. NPDC086010]|uniref:hypothetical protein n=1 Tax=Streptomyces sp. NPDC086010 TaxID=3365745 RepID=UPI0037CE228B
MDDETPSVDVTLWATLDDAAAAPRGDLLVHWFRTAADRLFPSWDEETAESWALVTPSVTGGRDVRVRDIHAHWDQLADALGPSPFHSAAGFHPPSLDDGTWVDDAGRVGGTQTGRGGSHTELSAAVRGAERVADAAWSAGLVAFLAAALDGANPAFARKSRALARGYSWVTGVPAELAGRLGGPAVLEATGRLPCGAPVPLWRARRRNPHQDR